MATASVSAASLGDPPEVAQHQAFRCRFGDARFSRRARVGGGVTRCRSETTPSTGKDATAPRRAQSPREHVADAVGGSIAQGRGVLVSPSLVLLALRRRPLLPPRRKTERPVVVELTTSSRARLLANRGCSSRDRVIHLAHAAILARRSDSETRAARTPEIWAGLLAPRIHALPGMAAT